MVSPPGEEERGPEMTGTAVFMASARLQAQKDNKTITHTWEHDIESLAYVLLYSIYKHAMENEAMNKEFLDEFGTFFAPATVRGILDNRSSIFRVSADRSIPLLLAYAQNDKDLFEIIVMTFRFLNKLQSQLKVDNFEVEVADFFVPPDNSTIDFEQEFSHWRGGLRYVEYRAFGGQDSPTTWWKANNIG
ncbi:hypothetical protein L226DRAFT_558112 [Lentinus tigrinus ALCF2SS1-7]|uniref:Fungal-type protein kinase domain-containing protein n=1 Tax=Lentinus tigrinus ALCF2SS1-6 TaxID=1328759 RepID=A0A5C2RZM3_9APHY|nr:hypothetical protein L227DRAFT_565929 [Lentinus tigrinus ALCF2SS1-6]RPD79620.1 hypothetical protein L226DRAFT_558112 [Lentinus tigrinus ALCF2SS1-7]